MARNDDFNEFALTLKSELAKASGRKVNARDLISGRVTLKTRYDVGMLNRHTAQEGLVLNEDVVVTFSPYNKELIFRSKDRILLDMLLELVNNQLNAFTSSGVCVKPIHSRPSGHRKVQKDSRDKPSLYVFDLSSLVEGKASLPYFLYTRSPDGSQLPNAIPVLSHPVHIRVFKDVYLKFEPPNITVAEVLDICRRKYAEFKDTILMVNWGIRENISVQPAQGKMRRTLNGMEFDLCDLLAGASFLPVARKNGEYFLSADVIIAVSTKKVPFEKGTPMGRLWNRWKPMSSDTDGDCDPKSSWCEIESQKIVSGGHILPTIKGIVTKKNVAVTFTDGSVLCYKRNTIVQDILWHLYRLDRVYRSPEAHMFSTAQGRVKVDKVFNKPTEVFKAYIDKGETTENILLMMPLCVMPLTFSTGTPLRTIETQYNSRVAQHEKTQKTHENLIRIWRKR